MILIRCLSGSLASAPVVDFKAFSRVTERSEDRSFGITSSFSVDSVNALRLVASNRSGILRLPTNMYTYRANLAKYDSSVVKHQAYLQNDRVKLVQLLANLVRSLRF